MRLAIALALTSDDLAICERKEAILHHNRTLLDTCLRPNKENLTLFFFIPTAAVEARLCRALLCRSQTSGGESRSRCDLQFIARAESSIQQIADHGQARSRACFSVFRLQMTTADTTFHGLPPPGAVVGSCSMSFYSIRRMQLRFCCGHTKSPVRKYRLPATTPGSPAHLYKWVHNSADVRVTRAHMGKEQAHETLFGGIVASKTKKSGLCQ